MGSKMSISQKPEVALLVIKPDAVRENISQRILREVFYQMRTSQVLIHTRLRMSPEQVGTKVMNTIISHMTSGESEVVLFYGVHANNALSLTKGKAGSSGIRSRYFQNMPARPEYLVQNRIHTSDSQEEAIEGICALFDDQYIQQYIPKT
jgi:nucleoside diphosphate kinase